MAVYKKNFLSRVVFRLDFDEIELGRLENFVKKIKKNFPLVEQKEHQESSMILDTKTGAWEHSQKKKIIWQISDKDRNKQVEIDTNYIAITYTKYKDSKALLKDIKEVFDDFLKTFDVKTVKRVGLRYVNEIALPSEKKPLDWKKYISTNLIAGIEFVKSASLKTSRTLGQIILREEDAYITFNYGLINKDYPNEIVKKEFLLDYDCVSKFPIVANEFDVVEVVRKYNKYIENLFELSIISGLRTILKKI